MQTPLSLHGAEYETEIREAHRKRPGEWLIEDIRRTVSTGRLEGNHPDLLVERDAEIGVVIKGDLGQHHLDKNLRRIDIQLLDDRLHLLHVPG